LVIILFLLQKFRQIEKIVLNLEKVLNKKSNFFIFFALARCEKVGWGKVEKYRLKYRQNCGILRNFLELYRKRDLVKS